MALEKFHYKVDDKREIVLPKFNKLPFGVMRKIRNLDESEQIFTIFEEAADPKSLKILDTLDMEQIGDLVEKWNKDAGVSVGESED